MEPRWLATDLRTHDGRVFQFNAEQDADRLPLSCNFSTQIPGGFGQSTVVLPRPDDFDTLDAPLLAKGRHYGPGNRTAYEGRVSGKPDAVKVGANQVTVEFEGPAAAFDDDIFRFLYATHDLTKWGAPSVQRRIDLLLINRPHQTDATPVVDDTGGPALRLAVSGEWDALVIPGCETWFDAGAGLEVAYVECGFDGWADADWILAPFAADDDATPTIGGDVYTSGTGEGVVDFDTGNHRYVGFIWVFGSGAGGNANFEFGVNLRKLGAYGPHGLTLYDPGDEGPRGVRGSDVLEHAISVGAPEVPIHYIEPSVFAMSELVFDSWENRLRNVIEEVTLKGGATDVPNDWGIYDKGFFWRSPDSYGSDYRLRFDDGVEPFSEGEDAGELASAIIGQFTDAAGVQRAVGYPGSGADYESSALIDDDPLNPVIRAGLTRKVITRDVGKTSPEGAIILSRLALREAIRSTRTGSYTIPSLPNDVAPYYLWSGDRINIEDGYAQPQKIVSTTYDHGEGTVEAHVGAPPSKLDVYLARLRANV